MNKISESEPDPDLVSKAHLNYKLQLSNESEPAKPPMQVRSDKNTKFKSTMQPLETDPDLMGKGSDP